jgi:protein-S-isoprenylcysteine O-methyltransferase Ste14
MRHPIYVAEGCLWVGMIVLLGSPVAAAVFACLALAGSRWIITREERALEEGFGEEYRAYRARVPGLPHFRRGS